MKRIFSVAICILCIFFVIPLTAYGDNNELFSFGRIAAEMPDITVELSGKDFSADEISATLGTEPLKVNDVHNFNKGTDTVCAYILVDLSTSMDWNFPLVRQNILTYVKSLGAHDKVVLITFGETVKTVLSGDEKSEEIENAVNSLDCNENGTLFYEALDLAYKMSSSSENLYTREFIIAFSDGIDYQMGSTTFDEVAGNYSSHVLPLYAACVPTASKDSADLFGTLARSSGGKLQIINNADDFTSLINDINDCSILSLKASSNRVDGQSKQLSVKVGDSQSDCMLTVMRSGADNEPPVVSSLEYDAQNDVFTVKFSEDVNGASQIGAYSVVDGNGTKYTVESVSALEPCNTAEIKIADTVNGEYIFSFPGITDCSQEANKLSGSVSITVDNVKKHGHIDAWLIVMIVSFAMIVLAAVIIICITFNRKNDRNNSAADIKVNGVNTVNVNEYDQSANVIKHHIKSSDGIRIKMKIKTGKTAESIIETVVTSSIIVGRSDICDIFIDDIKLSRQHFVIENDNDALYITDLDSKNGTMLNGIRIKARQKIDNGDKIIAGLSDIIIDLMK